MDTSNRFLLAVTTLFFIYMPISFAVPQWSCKGEECQEDRMRSTLFDAENANPPQKQEVKSTQRSKQVGFKKKIRAENPRAQGMTPALFESVSGSGNLPAPLLVRNLQGYQLDGKPTLVSSVALVEKSTDLHAGDMIHAILEQAITASPTVATPIRVEIVDGAAKGAILIGEATLDRELKRVLLKFQRLRDTSGAIFRLEASGLSASGEVGLVGEYHSQDGKFFFAELLTAGVAGFADATITRSQNVFGNYVEKPGLDTAAKKGVVSALAKTSERMADREKSAPEYTSTKGYQIIPILITEEPIRQRG